MSSPPLLTSAAPSSGFSETRETIQATSTWSQGSCPINGLDSDPPDFIKWDFVASPMPSMTAGMTRRLFMREGKWWDEDFEISPPFRLSSTQPQIHCPTLPNFGPESRPNVLPKRLKTPKVAKRSNEPCGASKLGPHTDDPIGQYGRDANGRHIGGGAFQHSCQRPREEHRIPSLINSRRCRR